jgi:hypothetical protein
MKQLPPAPQLPEPAIDSIRKRYMELAQSCGITL